MINAWWLMVPFLPALLTAAVLLWRAVDVVDDGGGGDEWPDLPDLPVGGLDFDDIEGHLRLYDTVSR